MPFRAGKCLLFTSSGTLRATCPQDRHFPSRGSLRTTGRWRHGALLFFTPRIVRLSDGPFQEFFALPGAKGIKDVMAVSAVKDAKRVVVKVGTSTLTYENGRLNLRRVEALCRVLSDLKNSGKEIVLVTSGAIGVGAGHLGL